MSRPQPSDGGLLVETDVETTVVSEGELRRGQTVERRIEFVCASGERDAALWEGLPLSALVEMVPFPEDTTHLLFTSRDGCQCCVDVRDALEGILAVARDGQRLGDQASPERRFVAPDVDGVRCLKNVRSVESRSLAPTEDRTEYETLTPSDHEL